MDTHAPEYLDATDRGAWMQTFTGRKFFPADPRPEEVFMEDIAHALSNICRYGGHTTHHYSVAQHSLILAAYAGYDGQDLATQRLALMHDAAEAYVGDHIVSLKASFPGLREIEAKVWTVVHERFGLTNSARAEAWVKEHDKRICLNEKASFMPGEHEWAIQYRNLEPLSMPEITFVPSHTVEAMFLVAAQFLGVKETR